jgi:hypothetical protein
MKENFFDKESFLYNKKISITTELCKEIIEEFENDFLINKYLFIYNINEVILEMPNDNFNFPFYSKLKAILIDELKKNIDIYKNKINSVLYFNKNNNYDLPFTVLNTKSINFSTSILIKKIIYNEDNNCSIEFLNKFNSNIRIKDNNVILLSYVWFLNDCDCELIFWNKYKFKPAIGTIFIFPISWCFPYEEIAKINNEKYIITGYIYKN